MTIEQESKIKEATGFSYKEILELPNSKFDWIFAGLLLNNKITKQQFDWFKEKRNDPIQQAIDIFGGKEIK